MPPNIWVIAGFLEEFPLPRVPDAPADRSVGLDDEGLLGIGADCEPGHLRFGSRLPRSPWRPPHRRHRLGPRIGLPGRGPQPLAAHPLPRDDRLPGYGRSLHGWLVSAPHRHVCDQRRTPTWGMRLWCAGGDRVDYHGPGPAAGSRPAGAVRGPGLQCGELHPSNAPGDTIGARSHLPLPNRRLSFRPSSTSRRRDPS